MKRLFCLALLVGILELSGCFELEQEITLNPDGSGKAKIEAVLEIGGVAFATGQESDPQEEMVNTVKEILEKSEGVTTWRNVSWKLREDGRVDFAGTAYFENINKFKLHDLGVITFRTEKDEQGQTIMTLGEPKDQDEPTAPAKNLTDEEVRQKVVKARQEYRQGIAMMRPMLRNLKENLTIKVPGKIRSASEGLNWNPFGAASLSIEGQKILADVDALMTDDTRLEQAIREGRKPLASPFEKPLTLVVAAEQESQFSYKAEVASAQKTFQDVQRKLNIIPTVTASAAGREDGAGPLKLENIRVGGVRLIYESDTDNGVRPFNDEVGYHLALIGEFSQAVTSVEDATLTEAVTSAGQNLLPKDEWDRRIHFPNLSQDKKAVTLEAHLNLPAKDTMGLQRLGGQLQCLISGGTQTKDLGISTFAPEATGTEYQAQIRKLQREKNFMGEWEYAFELEVKLERDMIKEVILQTPQGQTIEAEGRSVMSMGNSTRFEYARKEPFPKQTRVLLEIYDNVQRVKLPFELENVMLTGQPFRKMNLAESPVTTQQ